tara:strand:- start:34 stop:540 length:507 start_codon:yes stop_codon:yes gene_type:complete
MTSTIKVQNIKHTNDTTAMTIDNAGRIFTPARPSFKAYMSGDQSAPSQSTFTTIQFNAENHDIGGNFNTSNYTFTTPVAGVYYFYTSYSYVAGASGTGGAIISIRAGGTAIAAVDWLVENTSARWGASCSTVVSLSAGVGVTSLAYGPARSIFGGDYGQTQFCGYLIG